MNWTVASHLTEEEEEDSGCGPSVQWAVLVKKIKLIPRIPCIVGSEINYSICLGPAEEVEEDKWNHRNTLQIIVEFGYYTFSSEGFSAVASHSLVSQTELPTGCFRGMTGLAKDWMM